MSQEKIDLKVACPNCKAEDTIDPFFAADINCKNCKFLYSAEVGVQIHFDLFGKKE